MSFNLEIIREYAPLFQQGMWMTLKCTFVCIICGTIWGLFLGLGSIAEARNPTTSRLLYYTIRLPVKIYVSIFRGTPLFVQIMTVHFVLMPMLLNPTDGWLVSSQIISADDARYLRSGFGPFISCVVAITLNSGAYISEIFRAGIQSIDKGQMEAARSLGLGYASTMRKIILPQAFTRMLPALGNNAISIVKDSSLASAIGLADLAYAARTVGGAYASYAEAYLVISVIYWLITFSLSLFVSYLEKRANKYDHR